MKCPIQPVCEQYGFPRAPKFILVGSRDVRFVSHPDFLISARCRTNELCSNVMKWKSIPSVLTISRFNSRIHLNYENKLRHFENGLVFYWQFHCECYFFPIIRSWHRKKTLISIETFRVTSRVLIWHTSFKVRGNLEDTTYTLRNVRCSLVRKLKRAPTHWITDMRNFSQRTVFSIKTSKLSTG